jgi:hypothetical protein
MVDAKLVDLFFPGIEFFRRFIINLKRLEPMHGCDGFRNFFRCHGSGFRSCPNHQHNLGSFRQVAWRRDIDAAVVHGGFHGGHSSAPLLPLAARRSASRSIILPCRGEVK